MNTPTPPILLVVKQVLRHPAFVAVVSLIIIGLVLATLYSRFTTAEVSFSVSGYPARLVVVEKGTAVYDLENAILQKELTQDDSKIRLGDGEYTFLVESLESGHDDEGEAGGRFLLSQTVEARSNIEIVVADTEPLPVAALPARLESTVDDLTILNDNIYTISNNVINSFDTTNGSFDIIPNTYQTVGTSNQFSAGFREPERLVDRVCVLDGRLVALVDYRVHEIKPETSRFIPYVNQDGITIYDEFINPFRDFICSENGILFNNRHELLDTSTSREAIGFIENDLSAYSSNEDFALYFQDEDGRPIVDDHGPVELPVVIPDQPDSTFWLRNNQTTDIERFTVDGLAIVATVLGDGSVVYGTSEGVYRYDRESQEIVPLLLATTPGAITNIVAYGDGFLLADNTSIWQYGADGNSASLLATADQIVFNTLQVDEETGLVAFLGRNLSGSARVDTVNYMRISR